MWFPPLRTFSGMQTRRPSEGRSRSVQAARDERLPAVVIIGSAHFRRSAGRDGTLGDRIVVALSPQEVVERDTSTAGHDLLLEDAAFAHLQEHAPEKLEAARSFVIAAADEHRLEEPSPLSLAARAFKRAVDLGVGVPLLVVFLPFLLLLCLLITLTSPGPALFVQDRIGRNGRTFRLLKLRSMYVGADAAEHLAYSASLIRGEGEAIDGMFKLRHDPRITPLGHWLRRLSLDEVPQLWNVVRGDMSLIGPRPALPQEVALYGARAQHRLRVKPGMTGLWQVSGRSALTFDQMIDLDVDYWLDWSLRREVWIVLRTPLVVFTGRGAA